MRTLVSGIGRAIDVHERRATTCAAILRQDPSDENGRLSRPAPRRSIVMSRRALGLVALAIALAGAGLFGVTGRADAQTVRQVFDKVKPSVAVIRARGRDVTTAGQTRFSETGSGVPRPSRRA
jgi:hypothetical protein